MDIAVATEPIPTDVDIDKIIYPFRLFKGDNTDGFVKEKTWYVFDLQPEHWEELRQFAFRRIQQADSKKKFQKDSEIYDSLVYLLCIR